MSISQQLQARVVQNVAIAKQRFDSTAGPAGKIALILLPIAILFAHIASDQRRERDERERAYSLGTFGRQVLHSR